MKTSTPERLVVIAPNWLGDAVMALPLIDDLRKHWPRAHLAVAARAPVAPLFALVPGVNGVVLLRGGGGVPAIRSLTENAATLRRERFDAALLLPNSFLSAWVVARAGIPERWGFRADLRGPLLSRAIRRPRKLVHQADYYLALGSGLGLSPAGGDARSRTVRIELPQTARAGARALLVQNGLPDGAEFVVMAPGAAYGRAKQWPPERFGELARMLYAARAWKTVLVGTQADAGVCRDIAHAAPGAIDLAGRTDLPTLAGVLQAAHAVVTNDSGAMHLAAAIGARVVAIFGATNEKKSAPLRASGAADAPGIVSTDVWCRPCMLRECPIDHRCMTRIAASDVFAALEASAESPKSPNLQISKSPNSV
jgi:heptosyltransferase-2